ncbi:uncharacterized protein [Physcomitrium patens]|uniref:Uncharacterized protein n=1 Tax=Physcomitrium patens TaxID=3218 RepID=A0A2K1KIV3_PHYPA|nr:uncharacterized protein LOC112282972 [Physcomitrium patens]PNR53714.1 hypothetical protein PHYPA_007389 [Physcomitrium patens]|eukprot:XP_024376997.1 uncharacterized protein LOC112282972 [Physcomitrella patens]
MASNMAALSSSYAFTMSSAALLTNSKSVTLRHVAPVTVVISAVNLSEKRGVSRRQVAVSLASLSLLLLSSSQQAAHARDIPIFGLKKAKKITDEVVSEVKELVKEGESEAAAVGGAISNAVAEFPGAASRNIPSVSTPDGGLSPALQAGVVAGAGVVGVLVASAVVNTLVSPSK